jgi:hypothetical protein|tara:strand:+ start:49 stop:447 length:399 start_codon:yes stop_codon:yes gene_type:complete
MLLFDNTRPGNPSVPLSLTDRCELEGALFFLEEDFKVFSSSVDPRGGRIVASSSSSSSSSLDGLFGGVFSDDRTESDWNHPPVVVDDVIEKKSRRRRQRRRLFFRLFGVNKTPFSLSNVNIISLSLYSPCSM